MRTRRYDLRGVVIAWTIITTAFVWTSTMRLVLKPEISQWQLFGVGGAGGAGPFWVLPLIAVACLSLFYIEGRGRLRSLSHALLLVWNVGLALILAYGTFRGGPEAYFMGAAWGIKIPIAALFIPFAFFAVLSIMLLFRERSHASIVPVISWSDVHWKKLGIAAILLPVAMILYRLGDGFDTIVKLAIVTTVVQWILLAEGLGRQSVSSRSPLRAESDG